MLPQTDTLAEIITCKPYHENDSFVKTHFQLNLTFSETDLMFILDD